MHPEIGRFWHWQKPRQSPLQIKQHGVSKNLIHSADIALRLSTWMDYRGLAGRITGITGLPEITGDYRGITGGLPGITGITEDYRITGITGITGDYRGLPGRSPQCINSNNLPAHSPQLQIRRAHRQHWRLFRCRYRFRSALVGRKRLRYFRSHNSTNGSSPVGRPVLVASGTGPKARFVQACAASAIRHASGLPFYCQAAICNHSLAHGICKGTAALDHGHCPASPTLVRETRVLTVSSDRPRIRKYLHECSLQAGISES